MVKAHSPINWQNEPSRNTPINEANLNKMDSTIGVLDDRIIEQDTVKLDKSTANTMVKDVSFDESTGIFTITLLNGSTKTLDTKLEKIATNFRYDYSTQTLILTLVDGTTQSIDMSALVTQYEFTDSDTLDFSVSNDGKITATIKNGSITEDMLQPNYLAEIKVETAKSQQSMANAQISENNAKQSELNAKESEEQALEYSNNAQPLAQSVSGNNPTATNTTNASVIYLNNKGYTQQDGTPSPDAPIRIGASADKGYFDGVLVQGYRSSSNGVYESDPNHITNSNGIECKSGDVIKLKYESITDALNIVFYDKDKVFISGSNKSNTSECEATAPTNAKYVYFTVKKTGGIPPSTAKHISVTINGMYAVRVESYGGKNEVRKATYSNTASQYASIVKANAFIEKGKVYTISVELTADSDTTAYWNSNSGIFANSTVTVSAGTKRYSRTFTATNSRDISREMILLSKSGTDNVTIRPANLQIELGEVMTDYETQRSTTAFIPISSPLYDGDYIELYADGSGREYRKMGSVVYDGSDDEGWAYNLTNGYNRFYTVVPDAKGTIEGVVYCSHFTRSSTDDLGVVRFGNTNQNLIFVPLDQTITTVGAWKTWLQSIPIHVVYEKAEPTSTPLTAEQVQAFRQLQTFNGVTHINADGEVTVRYYCNNDSGDTVGMLHGMIEDVRTYTTEEVAVGDFLGEVLYKRSLVRDFGDSSFVVTTGVDISLDGQSGLFSNLYMPDYKDIVNVESFFESSTHKFTNAILLKKDKTGNLYCRNIGNDAIVTKKVVITFYYTKY